jgi:Type IV secretion system pilin
MKHLLYTYLGIFALSTTMVQAEYIPLSPGLPILGRALTGDLPTLINTLVGLSVAIAAVLAVIMVAIGGFKYMTTDSMFAMGSAKEQITNAIVGLLIVLAAILILKTINPNLVSMNLFNPGQVPG